MSCDLVSDFLKTKGHDSNLNLYGHFEGEGKIKQPNGIQIKMWTPGPKESKSECKTCKFTKIVINGRQKMAQIEYIIGF